MVQYDPLLVWGCGLNNISSRATQQPLLFGGTKSSYPCLCLSTGGDVVLSFKHWPVWLQRRCSVSERWVPGCPPKVAGRIVPALRKLPGTPKQCSWPASALTNRVSSFPSCHNPHSLCLYFLKSFPSNWSNFWHRDFAPQVCIPVTAFVSVFTQ